MIGTAAAVLLTAFIVYDLAPNIYARSLAPEVLKSLPEPGVATPMPTPDSAALARAAELLNAAERPLLLLGGGTSSPEAAAAVLEFMEQQRIPAVMSLRGLGVVPHGHELAVLEVKLVLSECRSHNKQEEQ